ncbi:hypothetical protein CYLTODRAFT_482266 [Cylindrobasidium torrendii FP15055 ss-10]|uniref:Uncharacterized protein n=1 Tax=Cylindrobasidium torrendii FP15055 ss-10 TaxID=1314674 RepID=A0A0D7AS57_9AGAR|nr:hypothetical protein CYLTODRAFT_482266 [Cylindrobasidium torrendii FP15055 ss-10]
MLFTTECHVCLAPNSDALVEFVTQTRLCKACLDLGNVFSDDYRVTSCPKLDRDIEGDVPFIELGDNRSFYQHVPSAVALLSETMNMDDPEYIAWCNLKGEENTKRRRAASKCTETYNQLSALWSQTRLQSVTRRLEAKGWKNELKHQVSKDYLEAHTLIADAKGPFTDSDWRSTRSTLIQYMRVVKLRRVQQERVELFWKAYSEHTASLPALPVLPPAATVGRSAELQKLISKRNLDETLTVDDFLAVLDTHLVQIASKWRSTQKVALKKLLRQAKRETNLCLAVSVFQCQKCSMHLWPTEVLAHSCFLNNTYCKDSGAFGVYDLKPAIVLPEDRMEMGRRTLMRSEIDPKATIAELDKQRHRSDSFCIRGHPQESIERIVDEKWLQQEQREVYEWLMSFDEIICRRCSHLVASGFAHEHLAE